MNLAQQTQNGVDITDVVRASLEEIKRLQLDIDGAGRPLTKASQKEVFDSLESLKGHLGLKGITETAFVGIVNALREQGIQLQEICRHNQLTLRFIQPIQGDLPFDVDSARERMALARRLTAPVTSFEEAREVYREVLVEVALLKDDDGQDGGAALALDKMTKFLKQMKCFKQECQKTFRAFPLDQCSRTRLIDFLDSTSWVVVVHEQAKAIKTRMDESEAEVKR